jgi:NitT/TauT family transport system ATP-binding protein
MKPAVCFNKVVKRYGRLDVLSGLSFQIHCREVVGLLGRSGIGKSTILKMIAGLERPTSGSVRVQAQRIGYVFQEPRLLPWRTTLGNVTLPLMASGIQKQRALQRAVRLLAELGLDEFMESYPAQLSGGMCQRVSLARAFAVEPDILLLDEPFSSLDIGLKKGLQTMLQDRLARHPATVVYVSHSPREVAQLAGRIFMMTSAHRLREMRPSDMSTLEADLDHGGDMGRCESAG